MPLAIQAKNYRGLVEVDWTIPPGLSVLVGANGAGKTTLLLLFDQLSEAMSSNRKERQVAAIFAPDARGEGLRYLGAAEGEPIVLGARWEDIAWQIELVPHAYGLAPFSAERLRVGGAALFDYAARSPSVSWQGREVPADATRTVLRRLNAADFDGTFPARPLIEALDRCSVYHGYALAGIRQGVPESPHTRLLADGSNVFALLNHWHGWRPHRERYEFVVESLRECFGFFGDLSFLKSGNTVEGWIVHRKYPGPGFPAGQSAEGWLVALLHFAAVAGANAGHVVGIDSFENALHPRALSTAIDLIREYAEAKGISVVITTQSPQVIDCFGAHPEKVFVLDSRYAPGPRPLTELRSEEWLSHFRIGRKYADGDFGAEPLE